MKISQHEKRFISIVQRIDIDTGELLDVTETYIKNNYNKVKTELIKTEIKGKYIFNHYQTLWKIKPQLKLL